MSDEPDDIGAEWLMEPPAPGEVQVYVKAGEGVELSPEARRALETLMMELQRSEVEGFEGPDCPGYWDCYPYSCTLKKCTPLYRRPCLVDTGCKIAEFMPM